MVTKGDESRIRKAVILDMDGVVTDTEPFHRATLKQIFGRFGIRYGKAEHATRFAGTGSRYIITTILKENRIKADIDALVKERTSLYQKLIRRRKPRAIGGVREFIRSVRRNRLKLSIASGGHRTNIISSLRAIGLKPDYFDAIISVEKAPKRKPHPQIFIAAARALRTKPRDCIVFEDSIVGVQAAKRAHMTCVALLTTSSRNKLEHAGADLTVKDFRDARIRMLLK